MRVLRQERVNDQGDIICAYCGKPIVKMYDCIGHHVDPLTEANVNDAEIALNPGNVMLVHHACHNKIHHKFGRVVRQIYVVYGSPLSGKSTYVDKVRQEGDLIVDIDKIWQCVSGCPQYVKPGRLRSNVFGVRDCLLDQVRYRRGKWDNAYIIGGYPLTGERERLCDSLGAREVFIDTPMEECLRRLEECADGRDKAEWEKYIYDWWRKFMPTPPVL